jgi:hypothetical protein
MSCPLLPSPRSPEMRQWASCPGLTAHSPRDTPPDRPRMRLMNNFDGASRQTHPHSDDGTACVWGLIAGVQIVPSDRASYRRRAGGALWPEYRPASDPWRPVHVVPRPSAPTPVRDNEMDFHAGFAEAVDRAQAYFATSSRSHRRRWHRFTSAAHSRSVSRCSPSHTCWTRAADNRHHYPLADPVA